MPGAEPLFIKGTTTGCLLLHGGGGGTTWDLKEFAEVLHTRTGMTVWLPALNGYGTKPEDLYGITFDDWFENALEGVNKLKEDCNRIFVVGHSLGGILTLFLASESREIDGIVTWAAALSVKSRLLPLLPVISKIPLLRRAIPDRYPTRPSDSLVEQGWIGYDWIPPSIGLAVRDGMKRAKKGLGRVTCPVLVVQGSADKSVSRDSPERICEGVSSEKKEVWIAEGAGHAIMQDEMVKDELFNRTIAFLESA